MQQLLDRLENVVASIRRLANLCGATHFGIPASDAARLTDTIKGLTI